MKKTLVGAAICAALIFGSSGAAFAGEIGGNGQGTGAPDHAASSCAFSGLEDFDLKAPVDPGVVQNWGQVGKDARKFLSSRGASDVAFIGEGCNPTLHPRHEE